jgi:hypothetical protein
MLVAVLVAGGNGCAGNEAPPRPVDEVALSKSVARSAETAFARVATPADRRGGAIDRSGNLPYCDRKEGTERRFDCEAKVNLAVSRDDTQGWVVRVGEDGCWVGKAFPDDFQHLKGIDKALLTPSSPTERRYLRALATPRGCLR